MIVDGRFNTSVCRDLESSRIRMLAGEGIYRVLNRNDGIADADYYDRAHHDCHTGESHDNLCTNQ